MNEHEKKSLLKIIKSTNDFGVVKTTDAENLSLKTRMLLLGTIAKAKGVKDESVKTDNVTTKAENKLDELRTKYADHENEKKQLTICT